uniref:Ig-like domain-containing protein n=1 Tax=Marmota marmota marmota TaxID=9994 RepID=A0A8C5ZY68_MARMA
GVGGWGPGEIPRIQRAAVGGAKPPRFIKEPKDQIGVSGGVASFVCQATGDPRPRVTWNKKGKKVNSQRFETIEFDESSGAVLRIQPLRTPRDENVYECVAQNPVGEVTVHAKLTVLRGTGLPGQVASSWALGLGRDT